jgi:hypothetical protein
MTTQTKGMCSEESIASKNPNNQKTKQGSRKNMTDRGKK